jgi:hypothetical protein
MPSFRLAVLATAVLALPAAAAQAQAADAQAPNAQEMILEAEPGTESLAYCDSAHNVKTCATVHIETQVALTLGSAVQLDGQVYIVTWIGPGYYLDTGLVLEPLGASAADLKGQRWMEIKPREGRVHTSRAWKDLDRNRALSPSDSLALDDAPDAKIKDVRLHLRVRPASGAEREKEREREMERD